MKKREAKPKKGEDSTPPPKKIRTYRCSWLWLWSCADFMGDGVGTGKVFHYINGKFAAHQRVYVMSNFKDVDGRYFYLLPNNFGNLSECSSSCGRNACRPCAYSTSLRCALRFRTHSHQLHQLLMNGDVESLGASRCLMTLLNRLPTLPGAYAEKARTYYVIRNSRWMNSSSRRCMRK